MGLQALGAARTVGRVGTTDRPGADLPQRRVIYGDQTRIKRMLDLLVNLLVLFAPFLALLAFMAWDRKQIGRPAIGKPSGPEDKVETNATLRRKLLAGLSIVAATMGVVQWMNPKAPPFSGRWGWLEAWAHSQLGQGGVAWIWFAAGAMLFAAAYFGRE